MFNDLLRQIDKYSVISFDIFDTLLKRDVFKPKDALDIVERVYGKRSGIEVKLNTRILHLTRFTTGLRYQIKSY